MKSVTVISLFQIFVAVKSLQVAVIGTTGNIGRTLVKQLSERNIQTRCLLRHEISQVSGGETNEEPFTSAQIASSLASLSNVEMVKGDVTDLSSIQELVEGCDVIFAVQGPPRPNPILSIFSFLSDQNANYHPYMTNYIGVQNIIEAAKSTPSVKRIVRLTAKGEEPFSLISILINMFGYLAKGWNYEGEQLLRSSGLDYTIIRPGLLKSSEEYSQPRKALALKDNGGDLKVSLVSYDQIAELCVDAIQVENTKKSTLTVMNVDEGMGEDSYVELLQNVGEDTRHFEHSLIAKHRLGARIGFAGLSLFAILFVNSILGLVSSFA